MAPHFTRLIESQYGYIKFYFNRIHTVEGIRYHISCMNIRGQVYSFQMTEMLGQWIIVSNCKCPLWIKDLEDDLAKAIKENWRVES